MHTIHAIHSLHTIHYITLHYITMHFITLHYNTSRHITSHHIASHYITFPFHSTAAMRQLRAGRRHSIVGGPGAPPWYPRAGYSGGGTRRPSHPRRSMPKEREGPIEQHPYLYIGTLAIANGKPDIAVIERHKGKHNLTTFNSTIKHAPTASWHSRDIRYHILDHNLLLPIHAALIDHC